MLIDRRHAWTHAYFDLAAHGKKMQMPCVPATALLAVIRLGSLVSEEIEMAESRSRESKGLIASAAASPGPVFVLSRPSRQQDSRPFTVVRFAWTAAFAVTESRERMMDTPQITPVSAEGWWETSRRVQDIKFSIDGGWCIMSGRSSVSKIETAVQLQYL